MSLVHQGASVTVTGQRRGTAPGLVMERAVQEMSQLRQEIAQFMAQYEQGAHLSVGHSKTMAW